MGDSDWEDEDSLEQGSQPDSPTNDAVKRRQESIATRRRGQEGLLFWRFLRFLTPSGQLPANVGDPQAIQRTATVEGAVGPLFQQQLWKAMRHAVLPSPDELPNRRLPRMSAGEIKKEEKLREVMADIIKTAGPSNQAETDWAWAALEANIIQRARGRRRQPRYGAKKSDRAKKPSEAEHLADPLHVAVITRDSKTGGAVPKSDASYHRVRMMALESVEKELGDTAVIKKVYHCHGQGSAITGFDHKGLHTVWEYHRKIFKQVHLLIVCSSAGWVAELESLEELVEEMVANSGIMFVPENNQLVFLSQQEVLSHCKDPAKFWDQPSLQYPGHPWLELDDAAAWRRMEGYALLNVASIVRYTGWNWNSNMFRRTLAIDLDALKGPAAQLQSGAATIAAVTRPSESAPIRPFKPIPTLKQWKAKKKRFSCPFKGCSRQSSTFNNILTHMSKRHNLSELRCPEPAVGAPHLRCSAVQDSPRELARHLKRTHKWREADLKPPVFSTNEDHASNEQDDDDGGDESRVPDDYSSSGDEASVDSELLAMLGGNPSQRSQVDYSSSNESLPGGSKPTSRPSQPSVTPHLGPSQDPILFNLALDLPEAPRIIDPVLLQQPRADQVESLPFQPPIKSTTRRFVQGLGDCFFRAFLQAQGRDPDERDVNGVRAHMLLRQQVAQWILEPWGREACAGYLRRENDQGKSETYSEWATRMARPGEYADLIAVRLISIRCKPIAVLAHVLNSDGRVHYEWQCHPDGVGQAESVGLHLRGEHYDILLPEPATTESGHQARADEAMEAKMRAELESGLHDLEIFGRRLELHNGQDQGPDNDGVDFFDGGTVDVEEVVEEVEPIDVEEVEPIDVEEVERTDVEKVNRTDVEKVEKQNQDTRSISFRLSLVGIEVASQYSSSPDPLLLRSISGSSDDPLDIIDRLEPRSRPVAPDESLDDDDDD